MDAQWPKAPIELLDLHGANDHHASRRLRCYTTIDAGAFLQVSSHTLSQSFASSTFDLSKWMINMTPSTYMFRSREREDEMVRDHERSGLNAKQFHQRYVQRVLHVIKKRHGLHHRQGQSGRILLPTTWVIS